MYSGEYIQGSKENISVQKLANPLVILNMKQ